MAVRVTWRLGVVDNTVYIATQPNVVKRLTSMERLDPPTYDGEDDKAFTFQLK